MNWLLIILTVVLLVTGISSGIYNTVFLFNSISLEGRVVGVERSREHARGKKSSRSNPIIEFLDPSGKANSITASVYAAHVKVGEPVWVTYNSKNGKARLVSLGELLLLPVCCLLFGVALLFAIWPLEHSSRIAYTLATWLRILPPGLK